MTGIEVARRKGDRGDLDHTERLLTELGATVDFAVSRALKVTGQPTGEQ